MGLPSTREETAAPGAIVKSATLNAIQDAIIDINSLARGSRKILIPAAHMMGDAQYSDDIADGWIWRHVNIAGSTYQECWQTDKPGANLTIPIPATVGDKIIGVTIWSEMSIAAAHGIDFRLYLQDLVVGGTGVAKSAGAVPAAATGRQSTALTAVVQDVLGLNQYWQVGVSADGTGGTAAIIAAVVELQHPI
jgi:hypothetical protein